MTHDRVNAYPPKWPDVLRWGDVRTFTGDGSENDFDPFAGLVSVVRHAEKNVWAFTAPYPAQIIELHAAYLAERERAESADDCLREIAFFLGVGGYNAPDPIDHGQYLKKIKEGFVEFVRITASERILGREVGHPPASKG